MKGQGVNKEGDFESINAYIAKLEEKNEKNKADKRLFEAGKPCGMAEAYKELKEDNSEQKQAMRGMGAYLFAMFDHQCGWCGGVGHHAGMRCASMAAINDGFAKNKVWKQLWGGFKAPKRNDKNRFKQKMAEKTIGRYTDRATTNLHKRYHFADMSEGSD